MTTLPAMGPQAHAEVFQRIRDGYEMDRHTGRDSLQARAATDDFIDWFAIVGGPDHCRDRLAELTELGLDHVYVIGGASTQSPLDVLDGEARLAREVLPRLRSRQVAAASMGTQLKEES